MTTIRRSGGSQGTVNQRDNGQTYNYTDASAGVSNSMQANVATILAAHAGMMFDNINLPQGVLIRSARLLFHLNTSGANATGADYSIYTHKVVAPPAFKNTALAGTNDLVSRFAAKSSLHIDVLRTTSYPSTLGTQSFDVQPLIQELVNQASWVATANRIIFLLINGKIAANPDYTTQFYGALNTRLDLRPELYIEYGNPTSDAWNASLGTVGDSHVVCEANAGYPVNNKVLGTWDCTIDETYAGMVDGSAFIGDGYGSGNQTQGYSPGGLVQDNFEDKYGDDVILYRQEFAHGGTTLDNWWFQKFVVQAEATGPHSVYPYEYQSGQSLGPGTGYWANLDLFLADPPSPDKRCLLWWKMGANDTKDMGNHSDVNSKINPPGSNYVNARADKIEKLRNMWVHVFETWDANDVDGWILLPGYQNFMVMAPDPTSFAGKYRYPPVGGAACDQPVERMVWGTAGYGIGFASVDDNGLRSTLKSAPAIVDPTNPDDPYILAQSSYMKTSAWKQIDDYGAFSTSAAGGLQWNAATNWAGTIPNTGDHTWYRTLGAPVNRSIDLWKDAMRDVTDITVNTLMIGENELITWGAIEALREINDDWAARCMFYPNANVHGPDLVNSADPSSYYAQPPRASTVKTDGIHPEMSQFDVHVRAYIDWLADKLPFLPDYIPPTTNRFFLTI